MENRHGGASMMMHPIKHCKLMHAEHNSHNHTQDTIDLTMFRENQFDEFLVYVYQDGMPLMTVNAWRANQMDLVGLFMDRKERDKLELAKKRSPSISSRTSPCGVASQS